MSASFVAFGVVVMLVVLIVLFVRMYIVNVRRWAFHQGRRFVELKAAKGCYPLERRDLSDYEQQEFDRIATIYFSR